MGRRNKMYFAIKSSRKSSENRKARVTIECERGGKHREYIHPVSESYKARKNTKTKKNNCPFKLYGNEQSGGTWKLRVDPKCGRHNHELGLYDQWHSSAAKLSEEEVVKVENLQKANVKPKQILKQLKIENSDNVSGMRHVENALQNIRRKEMGPYTPLQYFFKSLKDAEYYHWHREDGDTNTLGDVLFAHPKATDLLRLFPYVLVMDVTYRTNMFNLPLLEIIGVSPTGQNFHVAFGFLKDEKVESYLWAMQKIRLLFDQDNSPTVIMTDREMALINAAEHVFHGAAHLLCKRHIAKDVEKYVTNITKDKDLATAFSTRWSKIVNSLTESDYNKAFEEMNKAWKPRLETVVDYVYATWLKEHKTRFVLAWTKNILHFGARTSNRVESAHSQLKRWLGTSTGSFHVIQSKIHNLVGLQLNEIKGEMEKHRTTIPHIIRNNYLFSRLKFQVSHKAIDLIEDEYKYRITYVGNDAEKCGCVMRNSHGLPCAHKLNEMETNKIPIDLSEIHEYWKTLHIEPQDSQKHESQRQTAFQWFDELCDEVRQRQCSEAQMYHYANELFEMLYPECTNLKEPIQRSHRGRPKNKPSSSTKRDPSAWKISQKNASQEKSKRQVSKKRGRKTKSSNGKKRDMEDNLNEEAKCDPTIPNKSKKHKKERDAGEGFTQKSNCEQNIPNKSQGEMHTQTSCQHKFSNLEVVPKFMLQYIENQGDVRADGNCGFRVISMFVYGCEDKWWDVRMDLMKELIMHEELYKTRYAMGCEDDYAKALDILNCKESPALYQNWYCAHRLGPVVATKYQKIFTCWDPSSNVTFLPLETRLVEESSTRFMNMARINGNHFIPLYMADDCPLPPVSTLWECNCQEEVKYYMQDIKSQLEKFCRLQNSH